LLEADNDRVELLYFAVFHFWAVIYQNLSQQTDSTVYLQYSG
jgi:hypothetical protein